MSMRLGFPHPSPLPLGEGARVKSCHDGAKLCHTPVLLDLTLPCFYSGSDGRTVINLNNRFARSL
jgi:hypothetical protein